MSDQDPKVKGRWLPSVYYYLATIIGLGFMLGGVTSTLIGLRHAVLPELGDQYYSTPYIEGEQKKPSVADEKRIRAENIENERRRGWSKAIDGAIFSLVGAPVFFWHLRQARRREPELLGHS
ncbi:MAG: hypothetical protein ABIS18_04735 [Actinomycetota bacterium]